MTLKVFIFIRNVLPVLARSLLTGQVLYKASLVFESPVSSSRKTGSAVIMTNLALLSSFHQKVKLLLAALAGTPGGSTSPQTVPERFSLLQEISHYPDIFRLVCSHLDLTSILQLEVVCRDLRKVVVSERIFRDLVSAGIRSGQLSGGGWGWRRQRQSLLSSPSPLELSKHFKRKLLEIEKERDGQACVSCSVRT